MQLQLFITIQVLLLSLAQGLAIEKRTARESSPSGCLVVQGTDTASDQYASFGAAITALGSGTTSKCIFIYPGTYQEQVRVTYGGNLTIYGYTSE
jgi:pectinesterase